VVCSISFQDLLKMYSKVLSLRVLVWPTQDPTFGYRLCEWSWCPRCTEAFPVFGRNLTLRPSQHGHSDAWGSKPRVWRRLCQDFTTPPSLAHRCAAERPTCV
jgi:hypothetical protein